MKKILALVAAVALTFSVSAQTSPASKTRGGSDFTQVDQYLSVIKRLGIPTANVDTLNGLTSGPNSVKVLYNTTLRKLRIYDPVTDEWRDAIEADLTNYYTKAEVDALIAAIPQGASSLQEVTTGVGNNVTNNIIKVTGNAGQDLSESGLFLGAKIGGGVVGWVGNNESSTYLGLNSSDAGLFYKNNYIRVREQTSIDAGAFINTRMSGLPAINNDEFVTKSQLDAKPTGATSLQALTTGTGNNVTTNSLIIKGIDNDQFIEGLNLSSSDGLSRIRHIGADGGVKGGITAFNGEISLHLNPSASNEGTIRLRPQEITLSTGNETLQINGNQNAISPAVSISGRVKGEDAVNNNEFVTKAQLDATNKYITVPLYFYVKGNGGNIVKYDLTQLEDDYLNQLLLTKGRPVSLMYNKVYGLMDCYGVNIDSESGEIYVGFNDRTVIGEHLGSLDILLTFKNY